MPNRRLKLAWGLKEREGDPFFAFQAPLAQGSSARHIQTPQRRRDVAILILERPTHHTVSVLRKPSSALVGSCVWTSSHEECGPALVSLPEAENRHRQTTPDEQTPGRCVCGAQQGHSHEETW